MGFLANFAGLGNMGETVDLTNCADRYSRVQKNGGLIDQANSTGQKKQYIKTWLSNINLRWGQYVKCQQATGLAPQPMPLSNAVLSMISSGSVAPGTAAPALQTPLAAQAAQQLNMTAIPLNPAAAAVAAGNSPGAYANGVAYTPAGSGIPWMTIGIVAAAGVGGYFFLRRPQGWRQK